MSIDEDGDFVDDGDELDMCGCGHIRKVHLGQDSCHALVSVPGSTELGFCSCEEFAWHVLELRSDGSKRWVQASEVGDRPRVVALAHDGYSVPAGAAVTLIWSPKSTCWLHAVGKFPVPAVALESIQVGADELLAIATPLPLPDGLFMFPARQLVKANQQVCVRVVNLGEAAAFVKPALLVIEAELGFGSLVSTLAATGLPRMLRARFCTDCGEPTPSGETCKKCPCILTSENAPKPCPFCGVTIGAWKRQCAACSCDHCHGSGEEPVDRPDDYDDPICTKCAGTGRKAMAARPGCEECGAATAHYMSCSRYQAFPDE